MFRKVHTSTRCFGGWADMVEISELELREKLGHYLTGKLSLSAFRSWFGGMAWDVQESDSPHELVDQVLLFLSEFDHGHMSETILRRLLQPLADKYSVEVGNGDAPRVRFGSTSEIIPAA